ncbi:Gfo/Idh/MocA family oxidoreductase [Tunicatimonas pelagia]|uniref:Gfo/Idh/MocA family oxidoreductase n=1 Tax=Tunicatimonas pelagia TaxID=931531 RepID=UPI002666197B|nr:Gfo/Idh/MocA family oxidoreductase [Tunicatimonas pelagia]WKN41055.1 Gfo/Idh/MocA family oxidoreductase [Tunicatimonas pelagia]
MNRRDFIKSSAGATAGASLAYSPFSLPSPSQNKKYTTALIGSGWWGMNILREAIAADRSKVVALCDVDQRQLDQAMEETGKLTSDRPKRYTDYRELLAAEKPEIVIVATPDHWHPLQTIAAVEAGAHVYVEKPIGHTVNEGKAMVQAARANNRMVQVGTHRRVSPHNISGMEFLKSGRAGKIGMVRAFVHYPGGAGEITPNSEPPAGLDWDMWCGPAALVPYNERIHPKGFRHFLEFANGQIGDWGIHWLDQVLWWTEEKAPKSVHSVAARHIREDSTTAPDTQVVNYEFEDFTAVWEHRQYAANQAEKHNIGCYFYGTEGTFHMGWLDGWTFYPSKKGGEIIHVEPQLRDPDKQNIKELWTDFLSSIESDKLPVCDIEIGHRSTNMSLLGMLSHQLGRSVTWDDDKGVIPNDPEANALLQRKYRDPWEYPKIT